MEDYDQSLEGRMPSVPNNGPMDSFPGRGSWSLTTWAGVILAGGIFLVGMVIFFRLPPQNGNAQPPSPLFQNWKKPDLALVLTGQMHGYLQACGCSDPQYGGLVRRHNFMETLKAKGWPVMALDLGDLSPSGGPQAELKFNTTMKALDLMKYRAVGLGKNEFGLPINVVLAHILNHPTPAIVAANFQDDLVKSWTLAKEGNLTIGVTALIGPSVVKEVNRIINVKFAPNNRDVVTKTLTEMNQKKPDLVVVLYQGNNKEAAECARFCAKLRKSQPGLSPVNLILCLEEEEEPSGIPHQEGQTMILSMGHKGRYVGVVGVFRKAGQAPDLKYQLVSIGPEYNTPPDKMNNHPVMELMEDYAREVQNGNYISRFPRNKHPIQAAYPRAKYVGSQRCGDCHEHAYEVWKNSDHARAFSALETRAKHPSLRQFDGECVVCHTVGFQYNTGYAAPANTPRRNAQLRDVGCESCHGPGSPHVDNTDDLNIRQLMNAFKTKPGESKAAQGKRINVLDRFCQTCHDVDNDVHWGKRPFHVQWQKIIHTTPAKEASGKTARK